MTTVEYQWPLNLIAAIARDEETFARVVENPHPDMVDSVMEVLGRLEKRHPNYKDVILAHYRDGIDLKSYSIQRGFSVSWATSTKKKALSAIRKSYSLYHTIMYGKIEYEREKAIDQANFVAKNARKIAELKNIDVNSSIDDLELSNKAKGVLRTRYEVSTVGEARDLIQKRTDMLIADGILEDLVSTIRAVDVARGDITYSSPDEDINPRDIPRCTKVLYKLDIYSTHELLHFVDLIGGIEHFGLVNFEGARPGSKKMAMLISYIEKLNAIENTKGGSVICSQCME